MTKKDLKRLEKICWQQLDSWNHQGFYAIESNYVWFMHKGKRVVDPWQKEDYQVFNCIWPDHSDIKMSSGDPYEYYGAKKLNPFFERISRQHGLDNATQRTINASTKVPKVIDNDKWVYDAEEIGPDMFRYSLGEKGKNPLIVFGINPSTAAPEYLDATIKAVKDIVETSNKYNGYLMLNIYPQRATDPKCMHFAPIVEAYKKNFEIIEYYLKELSIKYKLPL